MKNSADNRRPSRQMMAWVLMAFGLCKPILDVQQQSLLGKRALLISSDLSSNPRTALTIADHVLAGGASVTLMVPLPQSGPQHKTRPH